MLCQRRKNPQGCVAPLMLGEGRERREEEDDEPRVGCGE